MQDWSRGYVKDITYTSGFYRELSPTFLAFLCRLRGYRAPSIDTGFTYCELGTGQGFGTTLLAATHPQGRFWAVDFNPAHVVNGRDLAAAACLGNIVFLERSFEELAEDRGDGLPIFDFVGLHGVWSWISAENRRNIVRFLQRRLKPGGVVLISYNALPGLAALMPLRELLRRHEPAGADRSDRALDRALDFAELLEAGGAAYFQNTPAAGARLKTIRSQSKAYLVHEYMNADWHPLYHADVVAEVAPAKLTYIGSAALLDDIVGLAVPEKLRPVLAKTTDPVLAETVKDFGTNKTFRRDVFIRGPVPLRESDRRAWVEAQEYQAVVPRSGLSAKFKTAIGVANGADAVYGPIYNALESGHCSLASLCRRPDLAGTSPAALGEALAILVGTGQVHPAGSTNPAALASASAFNAVVAREVESGSDLAFLAAPAVGTGVPADPVEILAWLSLAACRNDGDPGAEVLAADVWARMKASGRRVMQEGKAVASETQSIEIMVAKIRSVLSGKLELWRRLGIL